MKFGVRIMPREVILDTQGRAVEETLRRHKMELKSCRVGRFVEIDVEAKTESEGRDQVRRMTEYVLYNPLLETFEIERLSE
ncbi:MAG: phosphoribosylformylglycinamidine synthase subunit PurS [Bdellovibrionaceae bacterium]|nr:phosphoribosylformylglycinamidine synthase subunit PurS [Pseudobdellovibrionaceae bacterium]